MSSPLKRRRPNITKSALSALVLLASAPTVVLIAPPVLAQSVSPREAAITSARGKQLTLGIGSDDGARKGAIYVANRDGRERARLQITEVRRTESTALLLSKEEDFVLPVGSSVTFVEIAPLPVEPPAPVTPTVPVVVPPTVTTPGTTANTQPVSPSTPVTVPGVASKPLPPKVPVPMTRTVPVSSGMMVSPAAIAAVNGTDVTLNVGAKRGLKAGSTLPVLRDGNVVALIRLQQVNPEGATGTVIWRDEAALAPQAGDLVGVGLGGAPSVTEIAPGVPAVPIPYETGASNATVPTANRDYLYLGSLAASGLITSQPANVFLDDGSRRHRTAEDHTFTRAQIAGFIIEALSSPKAADPPEKTRVALGNLIPEYRRELRTLGVADEQLTAFTGRKGFEFGVSGQSRATLVGGDNDNFRPPFSESGQVAQFVLPRPNGLRTRSGFDTQTNIWARSGNLSFLASVDAGTDPAKNFNDDSAFIRRAILSYNANKHLRGLTIDVGRDEIWWGPGHFGTTALSDNAGPLNMIKATLKRGSLVSENLYAPLGTGPGGKSRSLYAKNTYIKLGSQTRIGLVETVLDPSSKLNATMLLGTFSPIPLNLVERHLTNERSNLVTQFYLENNVARGVRLYGELLIDDIAVNDNNNARNRMGTLLGTHIFSPKDPTKLGVYAEYANLAGRTYLDLNGDPDYNYYYRGLPLGYPVAPPFNNLGAGNDIGGAESLRVEAYWKPARRLRLHGGFEFADLNSEVNVPAAPPLPRFGLSRQQIYRFKATYDLRRDIALTARVMRVTTTQPNFIFASPSFRQNVFSLEVAKAF